MKQLFGTEVGLSDHTLGVGVAVASVALGAFVIEKHFTLSRADGGLTVLSLEPQELEALVNETERAWLSKGKVTYGPTNAERNESIFRRSIYASANISKGEVFTKKIYALFGLLLGFS